MSSVYLKVTNPVGDLKELKFAYTPQIDYSTDVKYDTYNTTHTNYQLYGYTRTENPQINMNCKMSAHTKEHFDLSHYTIRFLRTYSKMNYGRLDENRGIPPRILRFFAYGEQMFSDVPVVISKFNITFPDDIDYVKGTFNSAGRVISTESSPRSSTPSTDIHNQSVTVTGTRPDVYLPVFFQISISFLVQQNMYRAVSEFNLDKFAAGELSKKGYI